MPQYMLLIYEDPSTGPAPDTPQARQEFAEYGTFTEDINTRGMFVSGAPLQSTGTATTVRVNGSGEAVLTDGPFADTKDVFGGYYVIEADDLDGAIALAAQVPAARFGGCVEIRPVRGFLR